MINKSILERFEVSKSDERHITTFTKFQKLVCEENKKKFILETKQGVFHRIKLDGGIKERGSKGKKVDFVVVNSDASIEAYIELKGKDVRGGIKQVMETLREYKKDTQKRKYYAYIIHTGLRSPKSNTSIQNELDKLAKMLGRRAVTTSNQTRVSYSIEQQELVQCGLS